MRTLENLNNIHHKMCCLFFSNSENCDNLRNSAVADWEYFININYVINVHELFYNEASNSFDRSLT